MSFNNPDGNNTACEKLAGLAREIAAQNPGLSPQEFILTLGEKAAGIRRGPLGLFDLLKGGTNLLPGNGFRAEYDDGSGGQVRHFVGIAVSSITFGPSLTVWLSENIRRDPANTPDGRLTLAAVEFSQKMLKGELTTNSAQGWLQDNLCNPTG